MTDLDLLLAQLGANFENSNFENSFDADRLMKSLPPAAKKELLMRAVKSNGVVKHIGAAGDNSSAIHALVSESKGDLNITVTRNGVSINAALPYVIFGLNDFLAGYISTLTGALTVGLPAGTVTSVTTNPATGDVVFTYVNGINTDTVTVSNLGNLSYKAFLSSMNQNYFKTKYFLVTISDETVANAQFKFPMFFGKLSSLGMTKNNQLVFRSRINSWSFRKDKCEVVLPEQKVVADFSFASNIMKVDGLEIGLDFFMSGRQDLNTEA